MSGVTIGASHEASDRAPRDVHRQTPTSTPSTTNPGRDSSKSSDSSPTKRLSRPWDRATVQPTLDQGQDSVEEDELSDDASLAASASRSAYRASSSRRRLASPRRSDDIKMVDAPSSKRPKPSNSEASPTSKPVKTMQRLSTREDDSSVRIPHNRSSSPPRRDDLGFDAASLRLLSPEEVEKFLDLIFKHHPEPMTAESMRQSVDALYSDWAQYCAQRQVPVKLAKKPLMDEYAKIFNGVYGPLLQDKARSIAQELSNRPANAPTYGDAASDKRAQKGASSSRRSQTSSSMDEDSDEDASEAVDGPVGRDVEASEGASPERAGGKGKKNIAQVGRNGLAVLPPGLFDILRNHLRDDILSSIMPSVRTDLTEQTRELFLQNQDLFGRLKEMEERVRNQELWIRHLLARDPADGASPHVGPGHGPPLVDAGLAGADAAAGMAAKPRPFSAATRDPAGLVRHARHAASSSDHEFGPLTGDYFGGNAPLSPRQAGRMDPRAAHAPGMHSSLAWEGRSSAGGVGPTAGTVRGQAPPFATGRREPEAAHVGGYREVAPSERRLSYANEAYRRPSSWQSEPHGGRGSISHDHSGGHGDLAFQPPSGPTLAETRRMSAFSGSGAATRGGAPPSGAPGAHEEFRRPGPSMYPRDSAMSPGEPGYEIRRAPPGFGASQSESYFGDAGEGIKAPLPPRAGMPDSPGLMQRNKRGRPSKFELTQTRPDGGAPGRGAAFGANSHPSSTQPRPYLS
ncbi:hypothetical protein PANT_7d00350 [Moesziomyces antarcticus T-34]|uniref:Uncharacterized protein n=1 Tax=Pseudozyma antarctica (strain T-34) TaxID=1151754 RepID=M9LUI6_PSEA3|nr:hypothetical protein PANT_7d00350 [Moesziomyces antarcticus T-34]